MMSDDGVKDAQFVKLAGDASEGWYMTCPCTDPTANAKTKKFAADYQKKFNQSPGTYSAESFDVTNMIIDQLGKLGKDTSREKLRDALAKTSYQGLTKEFSFDGQGNLKKQAIFLYQVKGGKIDYLGGVDELTAG